MEIKKIGIACDHAGYPLKKFVLQYLEQKGYPVEDYGTWSDASCDYTDFGHALAEGIEDGTVNVGIGICGSGQGIAMTLNKHQGIRAGLAWGTEIGKLVKAHNNANVLVMPARFISYKMVQEITKVWLETPFEGGRHERRIEKIPCK